MLIDVSIKEKNKKRFIYDFIKLQNQYVTVLFYFRGEFLKPYIEMYVLLHLHLIPILQN